VADAAVSLEQLVRNAVYSRTRSGQAVSGRCPGRGGLFAYRSALPHAARLSARLAGSQNEYVLRFCHWWITPRGATL